ncbi:MAG: efflux RND transporter periplasmic adaptor subunit [Clostridiales bacterium]|nr:efflux RND transporter periplasmic adaptor subunit [Clostridiales bacterium]
MKIAVESDIPVIRKSRKKLIIAIVIIAVVAAAGIFGFFRLQSMAGPVSTDVPEVFMLSKTDLESKVTASGNFTSTDPVSVGSNMQGEVETVYVEAGEQVYAGDVLARLKTSELERNISDTQASISEAARGDWQKLDQAQRAFDDADAQYWADFSQTKTAVNNAQAAYDAALAAAGQAAIDKAKAELDKAEAKAGDSPSKEEKAAIEKAKAAYEDAKTAKEEGAKPTPEEQAAIDKAKAELDAAKVQRENALRSANSRWYDAKAQLDALKGTDSARSQRSQLETLNENLQSTAIVSPITGIVTSVSTQAGKAAMGDMFTIENTETLQISASIAEYDVIKVEKGMKAHITSNATGDQVYDGIVDYVAPVALDTGGNFEVKVLVTGSIGQLRPGMTATVEIVTASKNDIFVVPIDAVVTLPDGRTVVYAYEPGFGLMSSIGRPSGSGSSGSGPVMISGDDSGPAGGGSATTGGGPSSGGGSGPVATGDGPVMISGDDSGQATTGGGPVKIDGDTGGEPVVIGSGPVNIGEAPAGSGGPSSGGGDRREIEVTTGMETDYYIEISGEGLTEGLLILSDPLGRNVRVGGPNMFGMMDGPGGGQVIGGGPAGATVVTVDAGP